MSANRPAAEPDGAHNSFRALVGGFSSFAITQSRLYTFCSSRVRVLAVELRLPDSSYFDSAWGGL